MILIFTLSSIPGNNLPSIEFEWADKIAHFIVFGILAGALYRGLYFSKRFFLRKNSFLLSIAIGLIYGALDEIHQIYVPGRFASFSDWVADAIAVIFWVYLMHLFLTKRAGNRKDITEIEKRQGTSIHNT